MKGFLSFLDNNQGLIGFLSLIVAILGFFFVSKNIKKIYNQSQKNISGGVNQQAQNNGVNQSAGRDANSK